MNPKDIRNLVESYQNVYAEQEVSEDMYSTVKSGLEKGSKALENSPAGGVLKMLVGPVGGNKGKRTPSAADQKKKIAANESTVKMSATGREPIGDKVIRTIGDKLKKTFGGKGTDKSANESVELYNMVFNHLIEEGFASSEENAEKIISVMSDEWISSIVEENDNPRVAKNVGLVGPTQKAIDKIPFVRDARIAIANREKGSTDRMYGKEPGKVGKHTGFSNLTSTKLKDGSVTSPMTRYTDISPDRKR